MKPILAILSLLLLLSHSAFAAPASPDAEYKGRLLQNTHNKNLEEIAKLKSKVLIKETFAIEGQTYVRLADKRLCYFVNWVKNDSTWNHVAQLNCVDEAGRASTIN
ncbi:MAG: hypothetical protein JNL11_19745 [Bdellovibrionaceae bacterium]|nr:hypothetical protein [Pseudobdellovibrionaceae bacterium]